VTDGRKAREKAAPEALALVNPVGGRRRGRPKLLCAKQREELILDAMERVLVARGLHGASMAAIAREAGMSKRTVYEVFGNRSALFAACVGRIRLSFVRPLVGPERSLPLADRLRRLLAPDARHQDLETPYAILRAVIAEAARCPELASAFLDAGPTEARRIVREELDQAVASGEVAIEDTAMAAHLLCDMAYESPVDRLVQPGAALNDAPKVEARLSFAIHIFLEGVPRRSETATT
jgi:AcrR family transcriptional regulator